MTIVAQTDISEFVTTSDLTVADVILAVVVMVVSWFLSRLARKAMLDILGRLDGVSEDLRQLAGRLTKYAVLLLGVGIALTFLGAPIQPVLTAAVIVAVVAGLALRGIAENFAAGVVIQSRRPIQIGDTIEALGFVGVVQELNGRSVVIETDDGRTVHLPNSKVLDNPIVNCSVNDAQRTEVEVRSAGAAAIDETVQAILSATTAAAGVLDDPQPVVLVREVEPDRLSAVVRFWHDPSAGASVTSAVVREIADAERRRGADAVVVTPPLASPDPPPTPL